MEEYAAGAHLDDLVLFSQTWEDIIVSDIHSDNESKAVKARICRTPSGRRDGWFNQSSNPDIGSPQDKEKDVRTFLGITGVIAASYQVFIP